MQLPSPRILPPQFGIRSHIDREDRSVVANSNTLRELINYSYSSPTISANRVALLTLKADFIASFGKVTSIPVADLFTLFALVNLPDP